MGCDCACHGHETQAAEQPAPSPDTQNQPGNYPDEYPDEQNMPWEIMDPHDVSPRAESATGSSSNGSTPTHGGSAMTAPSGGNGGGDIMSVQDMRNFWEQAGTTAASASDPLQSAAAQLDAMAAQLEAVQAHAAEHGGETSAEAASAAETYRQLALKCHEAAAAVDPAMGGCANAHQGLERFRPAEEGLASLPNRHARTDAYVGS